MHGTYIKIPEDGLSSVTSAISHVLTNLSNRLQITNILTVWKWTWAQTAELMIDPLWVLLWEHKVSDKL